MKVSTYHSYDDLPLFLNAELISKVLGVSLASAYELMHDKEFPAVHVGSRIVVPMLSGIIADSFQFSEEDLRRRRAESVRNVKQTNGRISFEKRVRESVKDDDGWQG